MFRRPLLAAAGFALFTALPLLTPGDEVRAYSVPQMAQNANILGCGIPDGGWSSSVNVQSLDVGTADVALEFYDKNGALFKKIDVIIPSLRGIRVREPQGFRGGSVVISSDQDIAAVVGVFGDTNSDSNGSGYPCQRGYQTTAVIMPIVRKQQTSWLQNLTDATLSTDTWFLNQAGQGGPVPGTLKPREWMPARGTVWGANDTNTPGTVWSLGFSSNAFVGATMIEAASGNTPPVVLVGQDANTGSNSTYLPLPFHSQIGDYTTTCSVQNPTGSPVTVNTQYLNARGRATQNITDTVPAFGMWQGSATVTSSNPIVAVQNMSSAGTLANCTYNAINQRGRAAAGAGGWIGTGAAGVLTKRGYAFGAPSSKKSKVSAVFRNVGTKKVKVKMRVFNGDTGKKVQSGRANIAAGATATIPFKKKARGNNLSAEITIKGGGSVVAWLMRNFKGDVDFYAAVPR